MKDFLKRFFGGGDKTGFQNTAQIAAFTDTGCKRDHNEDFYLMKPEQGIFVVCDGMGGHNAGEVASRMTAETIVEHYSQHPFIELEEPPDKEVTSFLQSLSDQVQKQGQETEGQRGMGTTLCLGFLVENTFHAFHVGDSRVYMIRDEGISQLGTDHSEVMYLVSIGQMTLEEARNSPLKNRITQAIGGGRPINPEYVKRNLKKNDIVLLCSDGLNDMLEDDVILDITLSDNDMRIVGQRLVDKAKKNGGKDNITVMLIRCTDTPEEIETSGDEVDIQQTMTIHGNDDTDPGGWETPIPETQSEDTRKQNQVEQKKQTRNTVKHENGDFESSHKEATSTETPGMVKETKPLKEMTSNKPGIENLNEKAETHE